VTAARVEWALDELQDDYADRWWRDLDARDAFWLERVYANCMGYRYGNEIS
jgi:hypothetical protein